MNSLSLRQIRAFEAVARLGSFVAAADELCLTQSALSESIKQLEHIVGIRLFDRTTRRVALTDAGRGLLQDVRTMLNTLRAATRRLSELRSLTSGEVRLAAAPSVLTALVLPVLPLLHARHPKLKVTLREEPAEGIGRLVDTAESDFGVGALPSNSARLQTEPLLLDRFGVIAPRGHALLARPRLCLTDLADARIVGLTPDTAITQLIAAQPAMPDAVLAPALTVSNTVMLKLAVASGLGVAILPALAAREPAFARLAFRPLEAGPELDLQRRIGFIYRADRSLSPAAEVLWQGIRQQAQMLRPVDGIEVFDQPPGPVRRPRGSRANERSAGAHTARGRTRHGARRRIS